MCLPLWNLSDFYFCETCGKIITGKMKVGKIPFYNARGYRKGALVKRDVIVYYHSNCPVSIR